MNLDPRKELILSFAAFALAFLCVVLLILRDGP